MADKFIIEVEVDGKNAAQVLDDVTAAVRRLNGAADDPALQKLEDDLNKLTGAQQSTQKAAERTTQSLSTTRYALYDVSRTLAVAGTAMTGFAAAIYGVSIAWERNFANVIRTSNLDVASNAVNTLRNNFQDLASSIPITSSALAEIGTLGGQLGISAGQLTAFTSVVARFSSTTDLSVDAAATAFGRLNALLPDVQGDFEALGSSILKVGTNSVATESDIANIATQLSAMGAFAGLTAADVIGLSGALASVGVQPELARGTITRVFTLMSRAVASGGEKLENFARVAGVSANEFQRTWGTPEFGNVFLGFMRGIRNEGQNAVATLNDLGISSVRDVPALLRLAQAADSAGVAGGLLAQTLGDARVGFRDATELADQYGVIQGTVAAKIQLLVNNFENLMTVIGGGGAVFGGFLDFVNDIIERLTELSRNPVTNTLLQIGVLVTGLVGVLALLGSAAVAGIAGIIAMQQALISLGVPLTSAGVGLAGLQAQLAGLAGGSRAAALALGALRLGLIGVAAAAAGIGGLTIFAGITAGANMLGDAMNGISHDTDDVVERLTKIGAFEATGFSSFLVDAARNMADLGLTTDIVGRDLATLDDRLSDLARAGSWGAVNSILTQISEETGTSVEEIISRLPKVTDQMELFGEATGTTGNAVKLLNEATDVEAAALERLAGEIGITTDHLEDLQKNLVSGSKAFFGVEKAIQDSVDANKSWAKGVADSTKSTKDSWEDYYDGVSVSVEQISNALQKQLDDQEAWSRDIGILAARGATTLASELAKGGPATAAAASVLVAAGTEELNKIEDNARLAAIMGSEEFAAAFTGGMPAVISAFAAGGRDAALGMIAAQRQELVDGVPGAVRAYVDKWNSDYTKKPIKLPIQAETATATGQVNDWIGSISRRSVTINVRAQGTAVGSFSTGGPVYGPGTGTSDSIPAWLSHGEYVIKASVVREHGVGYFDAINRGKAPKFASGGPVRTGGGGGGSGMSYLDPGSASAIRSIAALADRPIYVYLGDELISKSAARGDRVLSGRGAR